MLAATIITFREIFEICLIISILSAGLNSTKNKNIILLLALIFGIAFSTAISFSFNYINEVFQDIGLDVLNISILVLSIIFLAYTSILLNNSSKELHNKINTVNQKFKHEKINNLVLVIVISLTISREGAELIIFLNGVIATGHEIQNIISGVIIGTFLGMIISLLLYSGLLKIPFKYFFKTINILLTLLAAGMASQLANLLHSSNLVSVLYEQAWDSSWIINDNNLTGNILYNLIGYCAKPTELQLAFYLATIIIFILLNYYNNKISRS